MRPTIRKVAAVAIPFLFVTIGYPVAVDQGWVRYNSYILPLVGLGTWILALIFLASTDTCHEYLVGIIARKNTMLTILLFMGVGAGIGAVSGLGYFLALGKSREHLAEIASKEFAIPAIKPVKPTTTHTPAPPTLEAVATEPLDQEALLVSSDVANFLAGREALAPPLPTKENLESGLSQYGMYEQETLRIYKEIYKPRIKQIRDKLAKAGRTNKQLDAIYENPQSSDGIRLVAKTLLEFARIPPTLSDLFKTDFPNVFKATDEAVLNSKTDNSVLRIERHVYMDFEAKSQFVGFYIPFLTDNHAFDVSIALVDVVQPTLDKLDRGVPVGGDASGVISAQDLIFSGRVFLYHEHPFSNLQKAQIVQAYHARAYDVSFRGLDYAGEQATVWYQEHGFSKPH
jgi:hypothetical protein